jgi:hypothetical protein
MSTEQRPATPPRTSVPTDFTFVDFKLPPRTETRYTPFLVVRSFDTDAGVRPAPGVTDFWESPDLWLQSSLGLNQAVAGEPNTVFARVNNYGLQYATGVFVKFWWVNPSLGVTEATAHLIGMETLNIPSGWSKVVQCSTPWVPVVENGGHECLIVEAYIPVFDPLTAPMYPWVDRHVGQRNVNLVTLSAGQYLSMSLQAVNIADFAQALTIEVQPVLQKEIPPALADRARTLRTEIKPPSAALPVSLRLSDERSAVTGGAITHAAQFKPNEIRTIEIGAQVPANAKPGETFVFRVVQRAGDQINGGYSVYIVVTDR